MDVQRRSTREEQARIQAKKRRKLKRKRQKMFIRFFIHMALLCTIVFFAAPFIKKILPADFLTTFATDLDLTKSDTTQKTYTVGKPQVLEGDAIRTHLKKLANEDDAFAAIYKNADAYPEKLLAALCNNPEMLDFVNGYLSADQSTSGQLTSEESAANIPLLMQWDKRWGYRSYGDNDIALSGCAPTSLSMVIIGLTKNTDATPSAVAEYAMKNDYYENGTGTRWSLMTKGAQHFGITGKEISLSKSTVFAQLEDGHPIICSMRPGDFTTAGHFIVLTGVKDGKVMLNDPNCKTRSNKLWDYDTLESQIKNLWAFST